MKAKVENYMKKIESHNETLQKMKYIKNKYKFIKKELTKQFNPNLEIYSDYYEEWKTMNRKFVVQNYELKDLINDIKYLSISLINFINIKNIIFYRLIINSK